MNKFSDAEILATLYSEKSRLASSHSSPGWSNWAIIAAILSLIVYLFDTTIAKGDVKIDQYYVLLFSTIGITIMILAVAVYFKVTSQSVVYYTNRISTVWDENPVLDIFFWTVTYSIILGWYWANCSFKITFYTICVLFVVRVVQLSIIIIRRKVLVPAGVRFNPTPHVKKKYFKIASAIDLIAIPVLLCICPITIVKDTIPLHIIDIKVASSIIGIWILIYLFLKLNSNSKNVLDDMDSIIDRVVYGGLQPKEALGLIKYVRYGGDSKQIVQSELSECMNGLQRLSPIEETIDRIISEINKGNISSSTYYNYSEIKSVASKEVKSVNNKSKALNVRVKEMMGLPNSFQFAADLQELDTILESAHDRISRVVNKVSELDVLLNNYLKKHYCRKSRGVREELNCTKRNDKTSIRYVFKVFPFNTAIRIIWRDLFKK